MKIKKLLEKVYQMGVESTFSPSKARARDKELEKLIVKMEREKGV